MGRVKKSGRTVAKAKKPVGRRSAGARSQLKAAHFSVRELDPLRKCGPRTSVERLFRVDELADGAVRAHLVFQDRRHGWYCEHGVDCPATREAQRIGAR
jgi:hypothetical protein